MGHGAYVYHTRAIASGATLSSGFDLGRAFENLYVDIPARSNTTLYIQASADNSTFRRVFAVGNATTQPVVFQLASSVTNSIVPIPPGHRYIKIESQDVIADGASFKIIGSD